MELGVGSEASGSISEFEDGVCRASTWGSLSAMCAGIRMGTDPGGLGVQEDLEGRPIM